MAPTFSIEEKVNVLFKRYLQVPSTTNRNDVYDEPSRLALSAVLPEQVWTQGVPSSAPSELINLVGSDLDDYGNVLSGSYAGRTSSDGRLRRYIKVPTRYIPGTEPGTAFDAIDTTSSHPNGFADGLNASNKGTLGNFGSIIHSCISSTYDPYGSYVINVTTFGGIKLPIGLSGGHYLVDGSSGVLAFYEYSQVENIVNKNLPPFISFYRYVGPTGLTTTDTSSGNYEQRIIYDLGNSFTTGDDLKTIQVGTEEMGGLPKANLNQALQFGPDKDGSWRMTVQGGGGVAENTSLVLQHRINGEWTTKFVLE